RRRESAPPAVCTAGPADRPARPAPVGWPAAVAPGMYVTPGPEAIGCARLNGPTRPRCRPIWARGSRGTTDHSRGAQLHDHPTGWAYRRHGRARPRMTL